MTNRHYTDSEIHSLMERFEARLLPKVEWTHEAHLAVAIWNCHKYDHEQALNIVRQQITDHNTAVGTPNTDHEGYHETITKFWLWLAGQFLLGKKEMKVEDQVNAFIASDISDSRFPLQFYSAELLFSVKARHQWMEPDLKVLDLPAVNH